MSAHPPATPSTSMPSIITAIEADRIWIGGQAAHHSEHAHYVRADIADALSNALEFVLPWLLETQCIIEVEEALAKAKGDPA